MPGHGKVICKWCEKLVAQCRCASEHKNISVTVCKECDAAMKAGTFGKPNHGDDEELAV